MRIAVHFRNDRHACVHVVPSLVERVFLGREIQERYVIRGPAGIWRYDCSGLYVGDRVQRAIERGLRQHGRPPSVVKATAPPS